MKTQMKYALASAVAAAMLAGCATDPSAYRTNPDTNDRTTRGAIIGATVGAVAGLLSGDDAVERRQRALVGAGIGGLAGGTIGNYQDRQERALRDRLAGSGVDVVRQGDNITLNMPDNITFGFNRSDLQPQFRPVLDRLASTLTEYNQTIIEVAGHTDSVGSDAYNMDLSRRRANNVASYLQGRGVSQQRMEIVAAGESRPIASNDTEDGRARNRRVEITLVPLRSGS